MTSSNAFLAAAAAAIITASTPLMAHAVSGGGGDGLLEMVLAFDNPNGRLYKYKMFTDEHDGYRGSARSGIC